MAFNANKGHRGHPFKKDSDLPKSLGSPITTQTSIIALSMDILSVLEDIDDIVDDLDQYMDSLSDDEDNEDNDGDIDNDTDNLLDDEKENENQNDDNNNDTKNNELINKPNFDTLLDVKKINNLRYLNMQKLKKYEEYQHSLSTLDEGLSDVVQSPNDSNIELSYEYDILIDEPPDIKNNDDDKYENTNFELIDDETANGLMIRTRSKAKTAEDIASLPMAYPGAIQIEQSISIDEDNNNLHPIVATVMNDDDIIAKPKLNIDDSESLYIQRDIREVARLLYDLVDCDDHKYKLHTYTNCFIAKQAISILEKNNLCLHRKHGIEIGREMQKKKLIHHILYEKGKKFNDNNHLFQFYIDDQHRKKISNLDIAFGVKSDDEDNKDDYNGKNTTAPITKLPSMILSTLDLSNLEQVKLRHKSTISQFKDTADKMIELPELSGWMEKKSGSGFKSWQKRWIIVRRTHMLWSKTMMNTNNPLDPNERKKFNNSITLLTVKEVRPVNSKRKRKFDLVTAAKTYHFKCRTAQQRDLWLNGLNAHLSVLAESMKFLRQSFLFKTK